MKTNNKNFITWWSGEFGWELMAWQGHLRWLHNQFGINWTVITREGREFLYEDFADEIWFYDFDGDADGYQCHGMNERMFGNYLKSIKKDKVILKPHNIGYFPSKTIHHVTDNFSKQAWIQYTAESPMNCYDLVVHARNRDFCSERNWGEDNWNELIKRLIDDGLDIASVGTESKIFTDVDNYHHLPLREVAAIIQRSGIVVGESSGLMHYAALVGTPSIVWGSADNKVRYEHHWNPLQIQCDFYGDDGWRPSVETVYKLIKNRV